MINVFQKIASIFMTLVVLLSTMSFTVDMHFCGDTLIETAFFKEAKGCGMKVDKKEPSSRKMCFKKNCCSDMQIIIDGQNELQPSFNNLKLQKKIVFTSFLTTYAISFNTFTRVFNIPTIYPPPIIVKEIYKLDEVYLI